MEPFRQPVATGRNGFGLFSALLRSVDLPMMPPVATTGLHKGSILLLSALATRRSLYSQGRAWSERGSASRQNHERELDRRRRWPDGGFELMIVTSDDRQHVVAPGPAAMTALVALAQADTVLVWDPADRRLIAANLRGTMPWTQDPAPPGT
jgi:hypothetical protein